MADLDTTTRSTRLPNDDQATSNLLINSFDTNFYTNSYENEKNQSACHVIMNPNSNRQIDKRTSTVRSEDRVLLSRTAEKQFVSRPSTICYRTFENESPFNSPLKRSSTFAGVFNSLFKQTDYNHLLEPNFYLNDQKKSFKLRYSKSNYDFENKFTSSEPTSSNKYKQLIATTSSTTSLLSNLIDVQSIKQSLLSMAVALTKHSTSNTGRIYSESLQSDRQSNLSKVNALPASQSIANTLSNSASVLSVLTTEPSSSLYTNNEASTVAIQDELQSLNQNFCTLCLQYIETNEFIALDNCECGFCRRCLEQYCTIIIRDHSFTSAQITCPSFDCSHTNNYISTDQIRQLVDKSTFKLYEKIKLDLEVHLDPNRVWCPRPNCETICRVSLNELNRIENSLDNSSNTKIANDQVVNNEKQDRRVPVYCKNCNLTFCLHCRSVYHGKMPCQSSSEDESLSLLLSRARTPNSLNEYIKKCPKCGIFIERDRGCAQMMCQKCKHVFCWFCLCSLEEDLLLRHYDNGSCKNKLGHSKGTLLWLRFQVIAVFLGFVLFLILLSPFLLISAPILLIGHYCCNVSISTKIWQKEDFSDTIDQSQTNSTSIRQLNSTVNQNNLNQTNNGPLIDLTESNDSTNVESNTNTHQQLIEAYIQNNPAHTLIDRIESSNNVQEVGLFEEHPIKLSGYDRVEQVQGTNSKFASWFKWRKTEKPDPPPRLSSMLDVEKHRKFMEELMADKLNLDDQLNSVEIGNHYMIISRNEIDDHVDSGRKTTKRWWTFWKRNS